MTLFAVLRSVFWLKLMTGVEGGDRLLDEVPSGFILKFDITHTKFALTFHSSLVPVNSVGLRFKELDDFSNYYILMNMIK